MFSLQFPCTRFNARRVPPRCSCPPAERRISEGANWRGICFQSGSDLRRFVFQTRRKFPTASNSRGALQGNERLPRQFGQWPTRGIDKLCRKAKVMHRSAYRGIQASRKPQQDERRTSGTCCQSVVFRLGAVTMQQWLQAFYPGEILLVGFFQTAWNPVLGWGEVFD